MKIDRSRLRKCTSEVPAECQALINKLRSCSHAELLEELKQINAWTFSKCELFHWIDVLDLCDSILEEAAARSPDNPWELACDLPQNREAKELLLWVLHFTTLLIEHSFSRHLYNSMEHLVTLLSSCDMHVVLGVLNLLYMFSKRSNFITRLSSDKRQALLNRLNHLAESWGGKENGFGLADCCKEFPEKPFPASATTLHFEFYAENPTVVEPGNTPNTTTKKIGQTNPVTYIHIENIDELGKTPVQIMNDLLKVYNVPQDRQVALLTHIRLAHSFSDYRRRLQCVQARLQALSVLVYSNALQENAHSLLHPGILEELVELLELQHPHLVEVRAAALRTITSIIHLDRNPHFPKKPGSRLNMVIDVTGASSYHGFLPVLIRTCISNLTSPPSDGQPPYPLPLATALFSFLYHLASYEAGCSALVSSGMMESLLKIINWPGTELEHITFGTRAVRVIDLMTNINMQGFQAHGGLASFINRLDMEVNICRKEQPFEIEPMVCQEGTSANSASTSTGNLAPREKFMEDGEESGSSRRPNESFEEREETLNPMEFSEDENTNSKPEEKTEQQQVTATYSAAKTRKTCLLQRAAVLKSVLNFIKKTIQDSAFSDSIRHVMEGTLPSSLKHIISNAEYYGPSLFLVATDVVTVYVFQEPSLLSSLQDNGLTDVVLHALLVKDVPATREVLGSLPNVFSALCLNQRGLEAFAKRRPFERFFKVLLSPVYLSAMRRRRSADPLGDTATNLGNAMDELMRHQPSLKSDAIAAIIKLLEELCVLGCDPRYVCWKAASKSENSPSSSTSGNRQSPGQSVGVGVGDSGNGGGGRGGSSSDEEEDDEEEASTSSHPQREEQPSPSPAQPGPPPQPKEKTPIALMEYIHNVMKFVDAILSNNSTDDHCREFVAQKGLVPLLSILGLPNLPVDYPVAQAAQAVASVCKSILGLAHETLVLKTGLSQLNEVLNLLKPLHSHMESPGGSVLLHELASAPNLETAFTSDTATPLLHAMNAAHGYVVMFVHVCRTSQSEIRNLSMSHWGSELGLTVLKGLSDLYMSLVWESTLLLALCSEDIPAGCDFGKEDMDKLVPPESKNDGESPNWSTGASSDMGSNGMTSAMEALSTDPPPVPMEVDEKPSTSNTVTGGRSSPSTHQQKYIKPLLGASSRLGRALAELFGLLVKLCMGSPARSRRSQDMALTPAIPSQAARSVATALNCLLTRGLSWDKLPPSPVPKFKLTFLICSVGFTSPMLFDEKRHPYHLMLQKFVKLGGQNAFFSTFHWALSGGGQFPLSEGLEHPNLPDGTGEFLDSWLMLLEKMVNPKAILDSPHVISSKCSGTFKVCETFDPIKYLTDIHKKAFEAVMLMWGKKPLKTHGARMTESILSILRHILRGKKIIKERTEKDKTTESAIAGGSGTGLSRTGGVSDGLDEAETLLSPEHLRQLMDMGFSRAHCIEALLHTATVEEATDYLLSYPIFLRRPDAPGGDASGQSLLIDLDLADDDHIMDAIAMSLGETETKKTAGQEETTISESIDEFTNTALEQCLNLLDLIPDTVYRICDLLVTITKRNGDTWRDNMLRQLIREIGSLIDFLIEVAESQDENASVKLVECEEANKVAGRIYLYTLFFEGTFQEMRVPCAQIVEECGILDKLVRLLVMSEKPLTANKNKIVKDSKEGKDPKTDKDNKDGTISTKTPKWLAPLLLLIDRLEKVAILTKRKQLMHKVTNKTWKWFDLSTGKWTPYSSMNNRIINDAYWAGESNVRITCSRRRYLVTFSCMTQVNEETDNRRLITMGFKLNGTNEDSGSGTGSDSSMETDESPVEDKRNAVVQGLDPSIAPSIVRVCVKLLAIPVDRDALHALMKVCLRLTRDYKNAEVFAREGGVKLLLEMTQASSFIGSISLSTLLIRHTLEEPRTLRLAMEKVIRTRTQSNIPPSYKEILFMTRQISSAVCRDPEVYKEVCENILRVDINVLKREDGDNRLVVKALPPNHSPALPMVEEVSISVVRDLLNALIKPVPVVGEEVSATPTGSPEKKSTHSNSSSSAVIPGISGSSSSASSSRRDVPRNNATATNDAIDDDDQVTQIMPLKIYTADIGNNSKVEPEEARKPLLAKSAILKILAEAVRSYGAVASLITEHVYRAGQSEMVTEDTTALAFLLDKLLPMLPENSGDRPCSNMARMLIAAIASCNHSPDVQTTLVTEVKAALTRTLALPESTEKHAQLQLLIVLISTMIDSCPPTLYNHMRASLKIHQYYNVNYIVRIMLKKGIITDLAKIPHSLDLSSPNMAGTINAALKPLETLSRIINQPMPGTVNNKFSKPKNRTVQEEPTEDQTGTTTSEATHAVGEEPNEDAENTEHDISVTAESLEPTSESQVHEEGDEAALEDIMDQLLESVLFSRDGSTVAEDQSSRPHRPMDIDEESLAMRDPEGDFDHARDTTVREDLMSSDSDSESNSSDDNEDEVQDDEDDEEEEEDDGEENEEEEEEEEEEGSSNYEEDGIDLFDDVGETGVFRMFPSSERDVIMIEQNLDNTGSVNSSTPITSRPSIAWTHNFPLPFGIFENPPSVSESNGISSHPLLNSQGGSESAGGRTQRAALRQRRYQYIHLPNPRNSHPPVILQRLLGPAAQALPLSTSQVLASNFRDTHVVVMDNRVSIFANEEEEQIDFVDQSGYLFGPGLTATLNNIPTALHWWIEESKLLDGDSQPDCCVGIVHKLIPGLEKHRNAELAERKEKRKKQHSSEKEADREPKQEKDGLNNPESGYSTIIPIVDQGSSPSTSQREDPSHLITGIETSVETTRQERTPDEDIIDVTAEMEVTVQEGEERPPPPPPEIQPPESRELGTANRNSTLELAQSLVDSLLGYCATEVRNRRRVLEYNAFGSNEDVSRANEDVSRPNEDVSRPNEDLSRESSDSDWIRRFLTDDPQPNVERNANILSQDPATSSASVAVSSETSAPPQEQPQQQPEQQASQQQPQQQQQQPSQPQPQEQQLPDGVDPSFLAALPDDMRDEVIAEQLRLQRMRQRAQATVVEDVTGPLEVNPEFLAALPPAIQEEVLAQQRLEQQRHAAASANPEDPVDAAAFFQNLQPSLRQAILTDMEESQISVLPPDLAQEAHNLRREWEARNRHMMQERYLSHVSQGNTALTSILRNSGRGRGGGNRYAIHTLTQRAHWGQFNPRAESGVAHQGAGMRLRGRQLLDHESMACLLVLLFVDEPKINTLRLHRVIRNLCYHGSTREWVVKALLSIMERSNDENKDIASDIVGKLRRKGLLPTTDYCSPKLFDQRSNGQSWLNISIDAALGCRANVFHIIRHAGKKSERQGSAIAIHPQAAPTVCRHTLELLISLAKSFPGYFVPLKSKESDSKDSSKEKESSGKEESNAKNKSTSKPGKSDQPDFWDILLKLDSCASKKGKSVARTHSNSNLGNEPEHGSTSFESSPFGQLIFMLNWSVIKRSSQLTDKLLRLLSLISISLTEVNSYRRQESNKNKKTEANKEQSVAAPEEHLRLAVQVLTSKSCSEEGLEDATALLLNLSHCPDPTRQLILKLLLEGAMELANMVCEHINDLMLELKVLNKELSRRNSMEDQPSTSSGAGGRGILMDRFTNESVVVTAPSKIKAGSDLQLPSMAALVSKTSSQAFFLRILKVIVQIREAVRLANTKKSGSSSSDVAMDTGSTTQPTETVDENGDGDVPMDTTQGNSSQSENIKSTSHEEDKSALPLLSESLVLDHLWETLSACLVELEYTPDHHAVLVLQPAVEAFFLVHSSSSATRERQANTTSNAETREVSDLAPVSPIYSDNEATSQSEATINASWDVASTPQKSLPPDQLKFLKFAETHRTVLNQILRQTTTHLADGPFSVLVDHTRVLDFDVKRRYFRTELERMDEGIRREELAVHVRRSQVFEDSFRELHRRNADEWKNRFYIVFEGEEGQDAGGLLREWYVIISREIFNPMYALFTVSPGDRVTYMINSSSHCNPNHLCYYKFVGRVIAKAIYDNKLLECYFTRSFYKHILGILVKHTDMESEDYSFYKGLVYLTEHNISDLGYELTFSTEVNEFGVNDVRDLIPNGRNIVVTEETKLEYIRLVCQMKMTGAIRKQLNAFLEGFYDIIPKRLISIFNEQELELLISGLPNVDIEDLKANTEYHKYTATSLQIQWFWRALRGFDQADRAKFLQFVTGTSKVPLQGFAALEGMNGVQKFQIHREDRSTDRLPSAHTCFNQLDLPLYETYDKLRTNLLKAIHECSEGFGFA